MIRQIAIFLFLAGVIVWGFVGMTYAEDLGSPGTNYGIIEGGAAGISGPGSSTDDAICRWDGVGGDTLQDSLITIADNGDTTFPRVNDSVSPTINFGDGDSGIFEGSDDQISFATFGTARMTIFNSFFQGTGAGAFRLLYVAPTATAPNIIMTTSDTDNGMGYIGVDSWTLVAGGVAGVQLTESAGNVTVTFNDDMVVTGTATFNGPVVGAVKQLAAFHANDAIFPSAAPAGGGSRNGHALLAYSDSADENTIFEGHISEGYANGALTVEIHWVAATATTGDVQWEVAFERIAAGGQDIDSDGFAAVQTAFSTTNAASGVVTVTSIAFSQAQADGIIAGEAFRLKATRDGNNGSGNDDMVGDGQILRLSVFQ